jgi:hypothetical protein
MREKVVTVYLFYNVLLLCINPPPRLTQPFW